MEQSHLPDQQSSAQIQKPNLKIPVPRILQQNVHRIVDDLNILQPQGFVQQLLHPSPNVINQVALQHSNVISRPALQHAPKLGIMQLLSEIKRGNAALIQRSIQKYGLPKNGTVYTDYKALQLALNCQKLEIAKFLIRSGCRINPTKSDSGYTPLGLAISHNYMDVLDLLLAENVNMDIGVSTCIRGCSISNTDVCLYAALKKLIDILKILLRHPKINVNQLRENGKTVIQYFLELSYLNSYSNSDETERCQMIDLLFANGATINFRSCDGSTALHHAARFKESNMLSLFLQSCNTVNVCDDYGNTPLHILLLSKSNKNITKVVEELVQKGARVDIINKENQTALNIVLKSKNFEILKIFLQSSTFNIDFKDDEGNTVLHHLIMNSSNLDKNDELVEIVRIILKLGAKINIKNENEKTAIYLAIEHKQREILLMFLSQVADVRSIDLYSYSLLYMIFMRIISNIEGIDKLDIEILQTILAKGVKVDVKNTMGVIPIHFAVRSRNSIVINSIIQHVTNLNICDDYGNTLLHLLCESKISFNENLQHTMLETTKFLLERGALVNVQNRNKNTPLHNAIQNKLQEIIKFLLDYDADVNLINGNGQTPLQILVMTDWTPIVFHNSDGSVFSKDFAKDNMIQIDCAIAEMLISKGAKVDVILEKNNSVCHLAAEKNLKNLLMILLNHTSIVNLQDSDGNTIFHVLLDNCKSKDRKCLKILSLLISKGLIINIANNDGETLLHIAAKNKFLKVAEMLLQNNADFNACDNKGNSVLHFLGKTGIPAAKTNLEEEMLDLFLSYGMDVNIKNKNGLTPLMYAAENGYSRLICPLINNGANTDNCVLHLAIKNNQYEVVQELVKGNVHIDIVNCEGKTALHIAVEKSLEKYVEVLLKNGADPNVLDKANRTPLHWACWYTQIEIIEKLLEYGADVNAKDGNNVVPLILTQDYHNECWDLLQLIIERMKITGQLVVQENIMRMELSKNNKYRVNFSRDYAKEIHEVREYKLMGQNALNNAMFLSKILKNNSVSKLLEDFLNLPFFDPEYVEESKSRFQRIMVRSALIEKSKRALQQFANLSLSDQICDQIMIELSNEDLRSLIAANIFRIVNKRMLQVKSDEEGTDIKRPRLSENSLCDDDDS